MGYVYDHDDDPFYDHDEATAAATAAAHDHIHGTGSSACVSTSPRLWIQPPLPPSRSTSVTRASRQHHITTGASLLARPTLRRSTSAGRQTAMFDAFLSDSNSNSDSDSDDNEHDDDTAALERMQSHADDMEYMNTTFQFDSPNTRAPDSDDDGVIVASSNSSSRRPIPAAAALSAPPVGASWTRRMSRAASMQHRRSNDSSNDTNSITRRFAGRDGSFVASTATTTATRDDAFSHTSSSSHDDSNRTPSLSFASSFDVPSRWTSDSVDSNNSSSSSSSNADRDARDALNDSFCNDRSSLLARDSVDNSVRSSVYRPSDLYSSRSYRLTDVDNSLSHHNSNSSGGDTQSVDSKQDDTTSTADHSGDCIRYNTTAANDVRWKHNDDNTMPVSTRASGSNEDDDAPLNLQHVTMDDSDEPIDAATHALRPFAAAAAVAIDTCTSTNNTRQSTVSLQAMMSVPLQQQQQQQQQRKTVASSARDSNDHQQQHHSLLASGSNVAIAAASDSRQMSVDVATAADIEPIDERLSDSDADALALLYLSTPVERSVAIVAAEAAITASASPRFSQMESHTTSKSIGDNLSDGAVASTVLMEFAAALDPQPATASARGMSINSSTRSNNESNKSNDIATPLTLVVISPIASIESVGSTAIAKTIATNASDRTWPTQQTPQHALSYDGAENDSKVSDSDSDDVDAMSIQWHLSNDLHANCVADGTPLNVSGLLYKKESIGQHDAQLTQQRTATRVFEGNNNNSSARVSIAIDRVSATLRSTLQRTHARLFHTDNQQATLGVSGNRRMDQLTSPASVCASPPQLARAFDHEHFYSRFARGGGANDESSDDAIDTDERAAWSNDLHEQMNNAVQSHRTHTTRFLLLGIAAGVGLGTALVSIDAFGAAFSVGGTPSSVPVESDAFSLRIATATQWLLLPGQLFLRLWQCVTLPLVCCHVLTGAADLAMQAKARAVFSMRAFLTIVGVSLVTTLEGLGAMFVLQQLQVFHTASTSVASEFESISVAATTLRKQLGILASVRSGTVLLECATAATNDGDDRTFLQPLGPRGDVFTCSNATRLSLSGAISSTHDSNSDSNSDRASGHDIGSLLPHHSSSALFRLDDIHSVFTAASMPAALPSYISSAPLSTAPSAAATTTHSYYPQPLVLTAVARTSVDALVPTNVAQSLLLLLHAPLSSTMLHTLALALLLGLVCGKRAFERRCRSRRHSPSFTSSTGPTDSTGIAGVTCSPTDHGAPADTPHYVLGVAVELQLALEYVAATLEPLAAVASTSLVAGSLVVHRTELLSFIAPMRALVYSVVVVSVVHVAVVTPVAMTLLLRNRRTSTPERTTIWTRWRTAVAAFVPAYAMCFATGSVVFALPTLQPCYAQHQSLTKSMAQTSLSLLSVLHRNAHALYNPIALLWLLQTSAAADATATTAVVPLSLSLLACIGVLTLASCFVVRDPVTSGLNGIYSSSSISSSSHVLLLVTLYYTVAPWIEGGNRSSEGAAVLAPLTLPLLVACDVLLARVVALVNLHDNMVVARLLAKQCDEVVTSSSGGADNDSTAQVNSNSVDVGAEHMHI